MIIALAVVILVVAAVVALTVTGAYREHRHSTPAPSVAHGFTLPQVGQKF
jgi:hypothetical protein